MCGSCAYGSHTLTYGPQDCVEGAHVLPARGEVLPGDLKLAVWELPYAGGGTAPQELGAMRSHVLCDQGRHLLQSTKGYTMKTRWQ